MKKQVLKFVLPALVFGVLNFDGASASAETISQQAVETTQTSAVEIQEVDFWSHEMRKIFGRRRRDGNNDGYGQPPPPPPPGPSGWRDGRHRHYPPPPPHRHYPPPPPPPRHRSVENVGVNTMPTIYDNVGKSVTMLS